MTTFKISQQEDIINEFVEHLENGCLGLAIASNWDVKREKNTLHFTLKEGRELNIADLIWFGYFTARG